MSKANVIADLSAVSCVFIAWGIADKVNTRPFLAVAAICYVIFRFTAGDK